MIKFVEKIPSTLSNILHVDILYNIKRKRYKATPQQLSAVK